MLAGASQARFPCGGGGPASEEEDAATKAFWVRIKEVSDAFVDPDNAGHAVHGDDREPGPLRDGGFQEREKDPHCRPRVIVVPYRGRGPEGLKITQEQVDFA